MLERGPVLGEQSAIGGGTHTAARQVARAPEVRVGGDEASDRASLHNHGDEAGREGSTLLCLQEVRDARQAEVDRTGGHSLDILRPRSRFHELNVEPILGEQTARHRTDVRQVIARQSGRTVETEAHAKHLSAFPPLRAAGFS